MIFEQIRVGGDRNFGYLVGDKESGTAIAVDPAYNPRLIYDLAGERGLTIRAIACTHSHFDHTNGNDELRELTGAKVWMHESAAGAEERGVRDGEEIEMGGLRVNVIHTPGHTADSVCYLVGGRLLSGDTLFVGKVGGTGYGDDARAEYDSLHTKLLALPDETEVWPGHDYGVRPSSTIGEEKRSNPFLIQPGFEAFLELKKNWLQYKKEHGIS